MSEEKLTSNTFEIEAKSQSYLTSSDNKESYKPISEDIDLDNVTSDTAKMVRENGESPQDGADEKMLGSSDKEALALKDIDVKFISGDPNVNGDAKIEIGNVEKAFTGMTKDELMKYANDPFWVKLRWVLFIAFWALWVAMLAGAVLIIILAPKCAAPTPLEWYQKGPMITIKDANDGDVEELKKLDVQAVVYELPAEETYFVGKDEKIGERIRGIVERFKDIKVVVDLTPNYVTREDELFKQASDAEPGADVLKAFAVDSKSDSNWLKVNTVNDSKAFVKFGKHNFLSQFGSNIDVKLDNPLVEEKLKTVLQKLVDFGVKGFRLMNGKHFMIADSTPDEVHVEDAHNYNKADYKFYKHPDRTYVSGLGDLIAKYRNYVRNITKDEGFLSIADSVSNHEEVFLTKYKTYGFDLPNLNVISKFASDQPATAVAAKIHNIFKNHDSKFAAEKLPEIWMQLPFTADSFKNLEPSAFYMFVSMLRGVLIGPYDAFQKVDSEKLKSLQQERDKVALQFGDFESMLSLNNTGAIGYTRVKSGSPGYFVILNPTNDPVKASFSSPVFGAETSLEVFMKSKNFDSPKLKYAPADIEMPGLSAAIFTFVPK